MALLGVGALVLYVLVFAAVIYFWQRVWHEFERQDSPSLMIAMTMIILTLVIAICGLLAKLDSATHAL